MSLTATLKTASSGLNAAQASLRAVSDNIANVNTPGYVRKAVNQQPLVVNGVGQGVKIDGVQRITDQYLQTASRMNLPGRRRVDGAFPAALPKP